MRFTKTLFSLLLLISSLTSWSQCAGDPTVVPVNAWNCYVYVQPSATQVNYKGYMSFSQLSFHTNPTDALANTASFGPTAGPGTSAAYQGCNIGSTNYILRYVRQGVPECGSYNINILDKQNVNSLKINGVLLWEYNDLSQGNDGLNILVWSGYLDASSTIEYTVSNTGGGTNAGLEIVRVAHAGPMVTACMSSLTVKKEAMGYQNILAEDFSTAPNAFTYYGNAAQMAVGAMALTTGGAQTGTGAYTPAVTLSDFVINYDQKIPGATLANGLSFNFGNFNPATGGGEGGFGAGLSVCFRTAPTPDVIEVKWNGTIVTSANQDISNGYWYETTIEMTAAGNITVKYGPTQDIIINAVFVNGYAAANKTGWKMAFSGKTASLSNNNHAIDDVNLYARDHAEYSINNSTWQASNTFSSLSNGSYTAYVRHKDFPSCVKSTTIGVADVVYYDYDSDGFGNPSIPSTTCVNSGNWVANALDCNDNLASINPTAIEICNSIDDDCDGVVNDGLTVYYFDNDNDDYGVDNPITNSCNLTSTHSVNNADCDDYNSNIHPNGSESCNSIDDDCDGIVDNNILHPLNILSVIDTVCYNDGVHVQLPAYGTLNYTWYYNNGVVILDPWTNQPLHGNTLYWGPYNNPNSALPSWNQGDFVYCQYTSVCNGVSTVSVSDTVYVHFLPTTTYYRDYDLDGYGGNTSLIQCSAPTNGTWVTNQLDCADGNANIHPGTSEVCNYLDDNCNGTIDEGVLPSLYFWDGDGDGFGTAAQSHLYCNALSETGSTQWVLNATDCNDGNTNVRPNASEICNSVDDNCNGTADEGLPVTLYYVDTDADGYGAGNSVSFCSNPGSGYSLFNTDCNNNNSTVRPNLTETCNGLDDNCNGNIDEGLTFYNYYLDSDNDGWGNTSFVFSYCSNPGSGYSSSDGDCNDQNAGIHPDNFEPCDNIDNDCDGLIDEVGGNTYYLDADGDGFGINQTSILACSQPEGYASNNTDCNDSNPNVYPGVTETCNNADENCNGTIDEGLTTYLFYVDSDQDGYGNSFLYVSKCMLFSGYSTIGGDCNDNDPLRNPGLIEVPCNGIDDDCDNEDPQFIYYSDLDGDGFGNNFGSIVVECAQPTGYVSNNLDCIDSGWGAASINPNATEICSNGIDDNCDGTQDNTPASDFYLDADGDGFGGDISIWTCTAPSGYTLVQGDCNDANALVYPNATEFCNGSDDNCNWQIDEGAMTTYYQDIDGDGFGILQNSAQGCNLPNGYALLAGDCDIYDPLINPGAVEICNDMDDNCDGNYDEGMDLIMYYPDNDGDGFGNPWSSQLSCQSPGNNWVTIGDDCNDESWFGGAGVNPNAAEVCDEWDNNCNGLIDEGFSMFTVYADADNDGYGNNAFSQSACQLYYGYALAGNDCNDQSASIHPQATEVCANSTDDNCNLLVDENCATSALASSVPVLNIGNYGTGAQSNLTVVFTGASNTVENPGDGIEVWYNFVANANAIRIALTGSNTVGDDNDLSIFNSPQSTGVPLIPLALENDVNPSALGISLDGGNEILYYDGLVPGQTYYICVRNLNFIFNTCSINISYLRGSQNDILPYTNYTGIYSDACQNFKAKFRTGATGYIVERFSSLSNYYAGLNAEWTYALPQATGTTTATSVCQVGRILPPNLTSQTVSYYTRVNVLYILKDGFGNPTPVVANGITPELVQLSPESALTVRNLDQCPFYKKVTGSIATNRSVCGSLFYTWEIAETLPNVGIPTVVNGPVNASRILSMASFPAVGPGKTYNVAVGNVHFDGYTASGFGPVGCVRTLGSAGMAPWSNEGLVDDAYSSKGALIYPNPSNGDALNISAPNMEGEVIVLIRDAKGVLIASQSFAEWNAASNVLVLNSDWASGIYFIELKGNGQEHRIRWILNR